LERALEQDGDIEVLRSAESREALRQHGRIGALLRYAYTLPGETAEQSDQERGAD
jgi:hypothetical protein